MWLPFRRLPHSPLRRMARTSKLGGGTAGRHGRKSPSACIRWRHFQTRQGLPHYGPRRLFPGGGGRASNGQRHFPWRWRSEHRPARILALRPRAAIRLLHPGLDNTPNMVIADNSTTSITSIFSDTVLLAGTLADPLFSTEWTRRVRRRSGLCVAAVLVGRAHKLNNFCQFSARRCLERQTAAWLDHRSYQGRGRPARFQLHLGARLRHRRRRASRPFAA